VSLGPAHARPYLFKLGCAETSAKWLLEPTTREILQSKPEPFTPKVRQEQETQERKIFICLLCRTLSAANPVGGA
jgi:hypothetical protein